MKVFVRNILLSLLALGAAVPASAETVTRKQAAQIAQTFFNAAYGQYVAAPKMVWNGRQLTTDRLFAPFYIFNHPKGGFVIISAESKAFPVLGYSRTSSFDRAELSEEETELLRRYAREIELIRYDDRQPERAVAAWRNLPLAINKVLETPYATPEFEAMSDGAKENIEAIDRRNNSVMMPTAVEFQLYRPEDYREYTLEDALGEAEEIPFSFYEDFIAGIDAENKARQAMLDEILSPTKPVIEMQGGAHFVIRFPENIRMCVVYDMNGRRMMEKYYKGTDVLNLDLSSMPQGFYAVLVLADDGKVYGFKLYR